MIRIKKISTSIMALILGGFLLLSFFVFPYSDVIGESPKDNVVISNCDTTIGWGGAGTVSTDTADKKEGSGAIKAEGKNESQLNLKLTEPVDISGMDKITFWIYLSDIDVFAGDSSIELGSAAKPDVSEYNWGSDQWKNQIKAVGWNKITLSLENANNKTGSRDDFNPKPVVAKPFDHSSVNWFRFYAIHGKNTDVVVKIDDIKAVMAKPEIHWDFSDVQGDSVKDVSGNNHHATLKGAALPQIVDAGPNGNKAISFNASGHYMVDNQSQLDFTGDYSVSMYVKVPSLATTEQVIFGKNEFGSPGKREFSIQYDAVTKRFFIMYQQAGAWCKMFFGRPTPEKWNHIVVTVSNNVIRVYLDGIQYVTHKFASNRINNNSPLYFGATNSNGAISQQFNGQIADVKIYTEAINMRAIRTGVMIETADTIGNEDYNKGKVTWSNTTYDTANYTEGYASVKSISNNNNTSVSFKTTNKIDITGMDIIEFDMRTTDIDMFGTGGCSIELTSSGSPDVNEINWSEARIKPIVKGATNDQWFKVQLLIPQSGRTGGEADLASIDFFRFYSLHNLNKPISINIDNLRAVKASEILNWDFEAVEGSIVKDSSRFNNNGALNGSYSVLSRDDGKAIKFDGGTGFVRADSFAFDFASGFVVSAEFNLSSINSKQVVLAGGEVWELYVDEDNFIKWHQTLTDGSVHEFNSGTQAEKDKWYSVTVKAENESLIFYVNGTRRYTTNLEKSKKLVPKGKFTVGAMVKQDNSVKYPLYGMVDNVLIYNNTKDIAEGLATVWDSTVSVPNKKELRPLNDVRFSNVAINDIWSYQHESSFIEYKGKIYASFTRNPGYENSAGQYITSFVSEDDGVTWQFFNDIIETDPAVSWTGTSFVIHEDKLWHFSAKFEPKKNNDYFPNLEQHAFILNEATGKWEDQGVNANHFYSNDPPVKMENGNWIFSGVDEKWWGAVAISDGDGFSDLRVIKLPINGKLYTETTLWVEGNEITAIMRVEKPDSATNDFAISYSNDYGETWTDALRSNMPATYSEPSAGILSTGQKYVIQNSFNGVYGTRDNLTISVSAPGESLLSSTYLIRSQQVPDNLKALYGAESQLTLAYPYSYQIGDYLYVIYSSFAKAGSNENHIEMAKFPIAQLASKTDTRKIVACVGDSITEGLGWGASSADKTYPEQMQKRLGSDYLVYNYGKAGATALKNGSKPYWNEAVYAQSLTKVPDITIIMLGTNDTNDLNWDKMGSFVNDLTELVNVYKNLNPDGKIYLATSAATYEGGARPARIAEMVAMQRQIAQAMGLQLVDINTLTTDKRDHYNDNTHPNDKGYELIGSAFASVILGQAFADDVMEQIALLPQVDAVTLADKAAIANARTAFNNLSTVQQELVNSDSLSKLIDLEAKIKQLEQNASDADKAKAVEDKIAALPEVANVKVPDKAAVQAARAAFSTLNDIQKALLPVASVNRLKALEDKIVELETEEPTTTDSTTTTATTTTTVTIASSTASAETTGTKAGQAQTGDSSKAGLFIALAVAAITSLCAVIRRKKAC